MGSLSFWHWIIVLLVVVLIFVSGSSRNAKSSSQESRGQAVFSSVSIHGQEAEHIDDRLPKNTFQLVVLAVGFAAVVVGIWCYERW
jgi:hypothetical protein